MKSITPRVVRKGGGMPKTAFFTPYWSEIDGQRFLSRFIIAFTKYGGCHITRIHMADNQREWPHDHSATFLSWKFGWYAEDVYSGDPANPVKRHVRHRRFGIHRLRHDEAHSITEVSPRLITVLFLGPRRHGSNYWTPNGMESLGMKMDDQDAEWS